MHLLAAQAATADDAEEAVDLGQDPAPIVFVSFADTELACLAQAAAELPEGAPAMRLANAIQLKHPMSVDLYVEKTLSDARIVVARLLGGRSYWRYGVEQLERLAAERGVELALLPGDAREDEDLARASTIDPELRRRLLGYLSHGGLVNARSLLRCLSSELGHALPHDEPRPLPKAGLYHPRAQAPTLDELVATWRAEHPPVLLVFYRAWVQGADTAAVDGLVEALAERGLDALPLFVSSLKDAECCAVLRAVTEQAAPGLAINLTGFALGNPEGSGGHDPLAELDVPVLQAVASSSSPGAWADGTAGLNPRDLAMQVALPEIDGRVLSRAVAFKRKGASDPITGFAATKLEAVPDRCAFVADQARAWAELRAAPRGERRLAVVVANYPGSDGRLCNGVGLDTPESVALLTQELKKAGYGIEEPLANSAEVIELLRSGPTNVLEGRKNRAATVTLSVTDYLRFFNMLPDVAQQAMQQRWGEPESDPHVAGDAFALGLHRLGKLWLGVQPSRGYGVDPEATYHCPDLVPPHGYLAFYAYLRLHAGVHAVIHFGKHGNLEWLPGKALALSETCWPELALGALPHLYPFIVNDPGEGSQAKRRASAVILDHLTPPLTQAGSHGDLAKLERLVDEHHQAAGLDPKRLPVLKRDIKEAAQALGLDKDIGIGHDENESDALAKLDNHLCELKELQIRDGLHVFGRGPAEPERSSLLLALARTPRRSSRITNEPESEDLGLTQALALDLGLSFDPLDCGLAEPWNGPRPDVLADLSPELWRNHADTVERLELLARKLLGITNEPDAQRDGARPPAEGLRPDRGVERPAAKAAGHEPAWSCTAAVLGRVRATLAPALDACGAAEIEALLAGLDGRRVAPGPSGAPTRGRPDVLPTGRNFYSVDTRAVPTPAAWAIGWRSAETLIEHHLQTEGDWPKRIAVSAWGTANMRTGGDDVAQVLAFLGCRPLWDDVSGRVTGVEVLPASVLGRPRVDVTLRVSGFFRDAFPEQMALIDDAVRAVAKLDEPEATNPLAAAVRRDAGLLEGQGVPADQAWRRASARLYGSKPGAYGAGLQALIDEGGWKGDEDLAGAFLAWGGHAYGRGLAGEKHEGDFERRLSGVEAVLHNQDNREHDILDSDDYYQFHGGMTAAVRSLSGRQPATYHADHSKPERPRVRPLKEEIGRIVRGRAVNPKWLQGVMRHGYKGAFEIAATVDYLFAFAATAKVVEDHHFEALFDAYVADDEVRGFVERVNPEALHDIEARFGEAIRRGLWKPKRNDVALRLEGNDVALRLEGNDVALRLEGNDASPRPTGRIHSAAARSAASPSPRAGSTRSGATGP